MPEKRKSKSISKKQSDEIFASGEWVEDPEFAAVLEYGAVYSGPDDQMIVVGMGEKYATWMNWGSDYRKAVINAVQTPHTIFALYKLEVSAMMALIRHEDADLVEAPASVALVEDRYPAIEGGPAFMRAVAEIGSGIIALRKGLRWEIESKSGVLTGVSLKSSTRRFQLDAWVSDLFHEKGSMRDFERRGAAYYAEMLADRTDYDPHAG